MPGKVKSMKEFVNRLFSEDSSGFEITLFDEWHFFYLFVIFGMTLVLSAIGIRRPQVGKRLLKIMAYLTIGLYLIDFFIMPLSDS